MPHTWYMSNQAFTVKRKTTIDFRDLDPMTHQFTSPYQADGVVGATSITLTITNTTSTYEGADYIVSGRRVNILHGQPGRRTGDVYIKRPYPTWLMELIAIGSEQHYLAQTNGYDPNTGLAVEA